MIIIMKRIICIVLALAMLLSLTACGAKQKETGTKEQTPTDEKTAARLAAYALSTLELSEEAMAAYPVEDDYIDSKTGNWDWEAYNKAYQAWMEQYDIRSEAAASYSEGDARSDLMSYFNKIIPSLMQSKPEENYAASPVNIYMALAMLSELTDGETRAQILTLLGTESIEQTRKLAQAIWKANYTDDGVTKSLLAASVWINEDIAVRNETIAQLAEYYYATAWQGSPDDAAFSRAFKDWLNEQTGGLLKDAVESLDDFDKDLILALASTIYFKAPWADKFNEAATSKDVFHRIGSDVETAFMHSKDKGTVWYGDGFKAVKLGFANGTGSMWILLPDENADMPVSKAAEFIMSGGEKASGNEFGIIDLSLPKFDADATTDLKGTLEKLGVTDAFDPDKADFSPLTDTPAVVSSASHSARVKIDEEGVEAAAFTVITVGATAAYEQPKVIEFKADRPFLFAVTGIDGLPLFIGTVYDPSNIISRD
jgi:serpin B